ncbi:MAG TPA: DUF885 family protein [Longimicrobiaceae bacterium]
MRPPFVIAVLTLAFPTLAVAQSSQSARSPVLARGWEKPVPELSALVAFDRGRSELESAVRRFQEDRAALHRRYDVEYSPVVRDRLKRFYLGWQQALEAADFASLSLEAQIDHILLRHQVEFELALLQERERHEREMYILLPFASRIQQLQLARRERRDVDPRAAAQELADLAKVVDSLTHLVEGSADSARELRAVSKVVAYRSAEHLATLRNTLNSWYGFYAGYDPLFTWWTEKPHAALDSALQRYREIIRRELVGIRPGEIDPIIGDPIGAEGLEAHLKHEMIPYTAEELIAIAEKEFEWCEAELLRASNEMGFGDDWKAAQEAVKRTAVPPGQKPGVVRDIAYESEAFIQRDSSITVPPLASEIWRIEMMSPERQLVNPFFLGGEVIRVSYPTDDMEHEDKLMSMRGNNPHFNRATVHHELIPGHHLQGFMRQRFNEHRDVFSTPFWVEGWSLYWEMVLWDKGFPRGPEDRIGMLFWRMHRAARIIFSLRFHLGTMTPEEAVDFLVERVGHERANAEAEVRRSFIGSYSPLYQAAYMLGGMQLRALRAELVDSGRMSERDFHDAIMQGGSMPIEMVRARLLGQPLPEDYTTSWRFAGDPL